VDESRATFEWGDPNFDSLRGFVRENLNWTKNDIAKYLDITEKRHAEIKLRRKGTLDNYFKTRHKIQHKESSRVNRAINELKKKKKRVKLNLT